MSDSAKSQEEVALRLFAERRGRVTLADLFAAGIGYTGRNAISRLRKRGYSISYERGAAGNVYVLTDMELVSL